MSLDSLTQFSSLSASHPHIQIMTMERAGTGVNERDEAFRSR